MVMSLTLEFGFTILRCFAILRGFFSLKVDGIIRIEGQIVNIYNYRKGQPVPPIMSYVHVWPLSHKDQVVM